MCKFLSYRIVSYLACRRRPVSLPRSRWSCDREPRARTCAWACPGRAAVQWARISTGRKRTGSRRLADAEPLPIRHRRLFSSLQHSDQSIKSVSQSTIRLSISQSINQRSSICIAHHREHAHASNALSSLTRAACHTATVCSLQTGWRSGRLGNPSQLYQGPHLP